MVVTQMLVLVGLIIVAAYAAMVFFGRQRRARFEVNNDVGLFEELRHYVVTGEFAAGYMHAFRTGTPIGRVVAAGLERFDSGKEVVFMAMRQAVADEQVRWRDAIFRLFVCGVLASGFGLIGVALSLLRALGLPPVLSLPQVLGGSSLIGVLAPAGLIVLMAVGITVFAFVGHALLLREMERAQTWLEETATEMLENAARVAMLSTRITSSSLPEPRQVVARGRS
jgi:hypothetical protein